MNQILVDRTTCISNYKKSEIPSIAKSLEIPPLSKNIETNEALTLLMNEKPLDQLSNIGKQISSFGEDSVELTQNMDINSNVTRPFIGKNKQTKINKLKFPDTNDNNEIDTSMNWGQFKENGSLAKRKVTGNTSSLGSNALSMICGRMWGQERILADLSNELYFEDLDDTKNTAASASISFANTRRPFIGETSKAVKVSKATKTFEKLNKQLYEERRRVETQLVDPIVIGSEISGKNTEIHVAKLNHVDTAINDLVNPEDFQLTASVPKENNKDEFLSSNKNSNKKSDAVLHSFKLKSQERRLITIELCPSFHFVNEDTGTVIDGCLLDRFIHIKLECNSISITPKQSLSRCLTFSFRACSSLISVLPNIYDMGLCNVGEYRNVLLEVKNESELPALIYPWVESKTLEISEQQQEVRIPANDTKQIKIGYMAKSPDSDYLENVILINAYNTDNSKEIELKAKNVDTHQILLHSLFYKLITYNDKRELQINFDRCLINMPNMRVFSIKNVHSTELKLNILWQSKSNIRLYLISPPDSSDEFGEEIKSNNYIPLSRSVSFQKPTDVKNESSRRDQAIEDLKWGDNDVANSINSIQARKTQSFRLSLGDELISGGGSTNPPTSLNFLETSNLKSTDGLRDSKASRSADLLSILDVTQGEINSSIPQRINTIRALNLTQKFSNDSDNPEFSLPSTISQQEKNVDNELRDGKLVDDGLELINSFDKDSFPFKLLDTFESVDADQLKQKVYVESKVKLIQKTFIELQNLFLKKNKRNYLKTLLENTSESGSDLDNSVEIIIPVNSSHRLALVFEPQQHNEKDLEEYNKLEVRELIQIHLPNLSIADTEKKIEDESFSKVTNTQQRCEPLRPRILPVCAKLVRSEMVVIQKNISFGRTIVGDNTSRFVSVVNRSSIPCVYAICKSGSISSGFLKIPEGRQGFIAALSTKYIEFIFKPTLPGTFEETLQINNVLNPRNSQTITIKAKVLKKEAFVITSDAKSHISTDAYNNIEKYFQSMLNFVLYPNESEFPTTLERSKSDNSPSDIDRKSLIPNTSNVAASFNIGSIAVGDDTDEKLFSFRIKNVTTKSRQFIVDATHVNAVVLLTHILPAFGSASNLNYLRNDSSEQEKLAFVSPFEPIPEVLQAVLSLRCRFESKKVSNTLEGGNKGVNENILSIEERKVLEDSLEQFQQKLKIAIRKNKIEKIEKYQKKIDKVIDSLKDNKVSTISNIEQGDLPSIDTTILLKPANNLNSLNEDKFSSKTVDANTKSKSFPTHSSSNSSSSRSEVTYHFHLEPEEEKIINIKLCFLPGMSYRSWNGLLPFCGYLRIFECKNEDHVKIVRFGAMIRSTRMNINSTVPFASGALDSVKFSHQPEINDIKLDGITEEEDSEMRTWAVRMQAKQSFISTVAQWSSLSTVEVYPKYRQLPQNMLSMCIKLVQGSKDRVMHGAMSIASLMEQVGIISLSIDEDFSANKSSDYITYNPKLHGNISFSLAPQTSVVNNNSNSQVVLESNIQVDQQNEIGSLATQIGASDCSRTNLGSKKDRIVKESNQLESESKLKGGSKIDIIVKWYPPLELDHTKTQHSVSSADAIQTLKSFKILGAIKVQLRIGNQIIGALQSVPFIGVLEHKSTINIPKYFTFDGVAVGSYRTCQICIANTSTTDDFHYVISSEEVALTSRPLGKLEIINGQTGIISPNSSKQLSLLFSATAPGKFEQKLWIRNIRDSFDQKRIVIQASISVTQMKFVIFPDLEYATDTIGKFKPIDLGFIQIQTIAKPELLSILPNTNNQSYKLRVLNVSGKDLAVTAVSNLKNQCYIYSDESCQQLAINCHFPKEEMIILYIIIRPVSIKPKSNNLMPTTSIALKNFQNSFELLSSNIQDVNTDENLKSKSFDDDGRELIGGIKLFFFAVERIPDTVNIDEVVVSNLESDKSQSDRITNEKSNIENDTSADVLSVNGNTRKLFETALSFKAIVGKSLLTISPIAANAIQYVKIPDSCDSDALYFTSKFQLKNTSKLFTLKYSYVLSNPSEECVGRHCDSQENSFPKSFFEGFDSRSCCFKVKILDDSIGELQPDESKWVSYIVLYSLQTAGVVVFPIRIVNLNTFEYSFLNTSTVLDSSQIQSTASQDFSKISQDNQYAINGGYFDVSQILPLTCSSPICLHHQYIENINKTTVSNDAELEFRLSRDEKSVPQDLKGYIAPTELYAERGYIEKNLCSWTICNNQNKSITLSPLSDLPITVKLEFLGSVSQENIRRSSLTIDDQIDMNSSSLSYSKKISSEILQWRKYLRRCGESFTLEPNCEVNVILVANEDLSLEETYLKDMSKLTGNQSLQRLKAGKLVQIQGVVGFLQAAHSLQTLFKPPNVPQLIMDPLTSNTLDETLSVTKNILTLQATNSNESKVFNNSITKSNSNNELFHLLPIIGLTALSCEVAYPLLQLAEKEVSLGSLRRGQKTSFFVTIENISEIDVPCVVDYLPSWLNFEKLYEIELTSILDEFIEPVHSISYSVSTIEETFIIPKQKKILLKLTAIAPNIDSKVLEYSLVLKTLLSTKTTNTNELDHDQEPRNPPSRSFIDSNEVLIRLQVDATKALELIPAEDEVLFSKNTHKARYNQTHISDQQLYPALDKSKEESGALFIRLIKDPFIIPPPVDISLVNDLQINESNTDIVPVLVSIRDTNQSHCRFSLKNKLNVSIIVDALIELNPLISDLLELAVIFRTNDNTCIELETGEVSQVEIRVLPQLNSRLNASKLENSIYPIENVQFPSIISDPNLLLQPNLEESIKTNFDVKLNTPILLGTIRFIPNLKDASYKVQNNQQWDDQNILNNQNLFGIMADDIILNDAILLDIVGFLQPGNTMSSIIPSQQTHSISESLVLADPSQFNNDLISSRPTEVLNFRSSTLNIIQSKNYVNDDMSHTETVNSNIASQAISNFPISPYINLIDKELYFYIMNPSSTENLNYFIKAKSYRHAGMKLVINNLDDQYDATHANYYDTIFPLSEPSRSSIPPSSALRVTLKLVPGKVSVAIKSSSTLNTDIPDINMRNKRLMPQQESSHMTTIINNTVSLTSLTTNQSTPVGPYTIICMPLEVWDANNLNHPPRLIFVYLTCEVALPILVTQPVSETNRNKQHLDRPLIDGEKIVYSESDTVPSSIASRSEDDFATGIFKKQLTDNINSEAVEMKNLIGSLYIRLRGVTPHSNIKGRYLIDLGQQILKREALEWMLTLENCSDSTSIPYRIRPIFQEELGSWLSLGQTGGVIEAGDSRSVMFYFRRNAIGMYMTYIAIENLFEKSNVHIISILMEVVSDPKKSTTNNIAAVATNNTIFNTPGSDHGFNSLQIVNLETNPKIDSLKPLSANNVDNDSLMLQQQNIENNDSTNLKKSAVKEMLSVKKVFKASKPLFRVEILDNNNSIDFKTNYPDDVILLSKESCSYRCFKINNLSDILLNFTIDLSQHSHGIKLNLIKLDEGIYLENEFHTVMDKAFKDLVNENHNGNENLLFSIDAKKHAYLAISLLLSSATIKDDEVQLSLINNDNHMNIKTPQSTPHSQYEQKKNIDMIVIEEFMLFLGCELFEDQNKSLKINICT